MRAIEDQPGYPEKEVGIKKRRAVKDSFPVPYGEGEESERPRSMCAVEPTQSLCPKK